jgi:hypothetical protein
MASKRDQLIAQFADRHRRKPKLGSGKRFAAVEESARKSGARDPAAVAAAAGIRAHGKRAMQRYAAMGRRRG